jgi:hypothetical protein
LGFELVYADTDSVFLKKKGASLEDFENVIEILARETCWACMIHTAINFELGLGKKLYFLVDYICRPVDYLCFLGPRN